jgi:hypothetical protein
VGFGEGWVLSRAIRDILNIVRLINEWGGVEVVINRDLSGYKLATIELSQARGGERTLPLWLAKHLVSGGLAGVNVDKLLGWLSRVHWRERVQKGGRYSLSRIPQDFYIKISFILFLLSGGAGGIADKLGDQKTVVMSKIREILNKRREAIYALSEISESELLERLSYEEHILLSLFREIIDSWKGFIGYGE